MIKAPLDPIFTFTLYSAVQTIAEFLLEILVRILLWVFLLPLSVLLASPVVLIGAAFTERPYLESVKDGYFSVYQFWQRALVWI